MENQNMIGKKVTWQKMGTQREEVTGVIVAHIPRGVNNDDIIKNIRMYIDNANKYLVQQGQSPLVDMKKLVLTRRSVRTHGPSKGRAERYLVMVDHKTTEYVVRKYWYLPYAYTVNFVNDI